MTLTNASTPVVLLFSGQGNPVIGMGSDLWDVNATTKQIWDCASDISGKDLRWLCLRGPMNKLIQTPIQQMAVTAINVTLFSLWRERFRDTAIIGSCGHSVGEYSALFAAGVFSLETLFSTVHFRANTMNALSINNKGAMLAVKGAAHATLSDMLLRSGMPLDISCDNTPNQQVVGGPTSLLNDFSGRMSEAGYNLTKLGVSGAWHTRLMGEGIQPMRDFLAGQPIAAPEHEVLMNVTARAESAPTQLVENLALHLTQTVKWTDTLSYFLHHASAPQFIEMSNKSYLGQMLADFPGSSAPVLHCRKLLAM
ncbi:[acyl-carrier-protein] S-malonyltransferase [Izhakiella capsodis]|uniref:[acyl-carrier-protein] S-malonyltransferase n=1 Tax=Izhakiella capsodis TaxID=1367852 RepID=A0A1I4XDJ1_9GAMM|nr:ACP S-malonyltransferase [Izhakiella capsodis]SFN23988.1 [acyl-carrier-protein] S-malonyltransferase [Izhakiella capsodis]